MQAQQLTTKEWLKQGRAMRHGIRIGIKGKLDRIEELQTMAEGITIPTDKEHIKGGKSEDKISAIVASIVDYQQEIANDLEFYIELQRKMQSKINICFNQEQKAVLELYYLNGLTWGKVAEKMNCSEKTVNRTHGRALQYIDNVQKCPLMSVL